MEQVINLLKGHFIDMETQGISLLLFCACLLYLLLSKNKKGSTYVTFVALLWVLVLNPLSYNNITTFWFFDEYWKIFAVLVPVVGIAYAFVSLIADAKGKWGKGCMVLACVFLVMLTESFKFEMPRIQVPENTLGVSRELIELDEILLASGIVTHNMIAPRDIVAHIREIDAGVSLLYSEELIEHMANQTYADEDEQYVQYIMHCASVVSAPGAVENQLNVAELYDSNCIVLDLEYDDEALMGERGYEQIGVTENYVVYVKDAYEN